MTLEILGIDHVPVERFGSPEGIAQYNDALTRLASGDDIHRVFVAECGEELVGLSEKAVEGWIEAAKTHEA